MNLEKIEYRKAVFGQNAQDIGQYPWRCPTFLRFLQVHMLSSPKEKPGSSDRDLYRADRNVHDLSRNAFRIQIELMYCPFLKAYS